MFSRKGFKGEISQYLLTFRTAASLRLKLLKLFQPTLILAFIVLPLGVAHVARLEELLVHSQCAAQGTIITEFFGDFSPIYAAKVIIFRYIPNLTYTSKHQAYIEDVQKKKMQIAEKKSQNANKRREKYNELRNGGMTQAEARKELRISVSTSKRYEKWRKANAK